MLASSTTLTMTGKYLKSIGQDFHNLWTIFGLDRSQKRQELRLMRIKSDQSPDG